MNASLFVVNSTATHFRNAVRFSSTVHITGPAGAAGNLLIVSTGTPGASVRNVFLRVTSTGTVSVHGKGAFGTGGADVAEMYPSDDKLEPGDVVAAAGKGKVRRYRADKDGGRTLGIVSTSPGLVAGLEAGKNMEDMTGSFAIALTGRVPVKVTLETGPIRAGDMLAPSRRSGYASKAEKTGIVVGIALEDFMPTEENPDKVLAFVNPHSWVDPRDFEDLSKRVHELESKIFEKKNR